MQNSLPRATIGGLPAAHQVGVDRLLASYRAVPADATVRLAKKSSNLFRARDAATAPGLDVSGLTGVLAVDVSGRTADVAGMCTYEDLVAATLPFGLAPMVVPQLKTITLGGAVTGLGIESTSFRNGLPHESVLEMDVLTGAGEIVTATRDNEHADLFSGFANSYGTLGYATRLRIELEPVKPFVALRHLRFHDLDELADATARISTLREHEGVAVDYLDGVVFTATESYLTLGTQTDEPGPVSDYTGQQVFYRSIQERRTDRLTIGDYLWRWDTDWFWCSRAFGAQNPTVRRFWPRRLRRSSFYSRLIGLDARYHVADRLEARKGRPARERVVQDVEVPVENTAAFLRWFLDEVPIEPLWLCPLRLRDTPEHPARTWDLYPMATDRTYVNVGFWSTVPVTPGVDGATNRLIEAQVTQFDGHKSLYSDSYYSEDEFAALYGGGLYESLKRRYDPSTRLLDLYAKAVRRR
ncbi:FAD-binding oxidoreductase [Rhodococcus antarcticus]|uniref:Delta(24)-sterol reductase n=1 Tax=Rhodococcus antarcticus TaxID=2987751 RepID=A0ABY6NYN7_9NOCA|nr:FAD-binding oxidoreductase [Rhodococcus antarcticus]UZJ24507.1 FAD-binding oxidoreductase [Rhodococcus antarcticus]